MVIVEHQGSASPRCVFEYSRVQNFLKALRADPRVAFIYIIVRYRRDKIVLIITYRRLSKPSVGGQLGRLDMKCTFHVYVESLSSPFIVALRCINRTTVNEIQKIDSKTPASPST